MPDDLFGQADDGEDVSFGDDIEDGDEEGEAEIDED